MEELLKIIEKHKTLEFRIVGGSIKVSGFLYFRKKDQPDFYISLEDKYYKKILKLLKKIVEGGE